MEEKVNIRFISYLFGQNGFPAKSELAITDNECLKIAQEIIAREDEFNLSKENYKKEFKIQHYEEMKSYFSEIFGNSSRFVKDLQTEINELKNDYWNLDSNGYSYDDAILRIRAVFDLYG